MARVVPLLAPPRPQLAQDAGDGLRSAAFGDIYYSPEDGLAESEAVFLAGCGLPEAWAGRRVFVVGELGFGTGLNLLAVWRLWRRARPPGGRLHFVSVEGYPLRRAEAARALAAFPEAADLARALLDAWPPRIKGVHRRCLPDGVFLTLAHLEASEALAALDLEADAWFLDGFAPAKNPDMWRTEVLQAVAARSRPGARLATFTVAGAVRRGLEAAGFAVAKREGFGRKRERLEAVYEGPPPAPLAPLQQRRAAPEGPVLVLGAGIAGACAAAALRRRGVDVTVLDAGPGPAVGASGMPAGLVAPRLDLDDRPAARFHRAAYAYALWAYAGSPAFRATGVVRAGRDAKEAERLQRLLEAEALPPDMAVQVRASNWGAAEDAPAVLFPEGGLLDPRAFVSEALLPLRTCWNAHVARLTREGALWIARDAYGDVLGEAAACVLALGSALPCLAQARGLVVQATRGQVTLARLDGPSPTRPLVWGAYAAPLADGRLLVGATHDPAGDAPPAPDPQSDARNLAALAAFAPGLAARIDRSGLESRVGVRAGTPDRLPYVGALPDADALRASWDAAGGEAGAAPPPAHEGLYVLGGLGGRGLVWAPLLGEAIASEMMGEPSPLETGAAAALHPARALLRAIKRGSG